MRTIELTRDHAELLDELLKDYVQRRGPNVEWAQEIAEQLWQVTGMTPWDQRRQE